MKEILYFEEEKWFADILINDIRKHQHWNVTHVVTPAEFFQRLNSNIQYELFILDIMAPMVLFTEADLDALIDAQLRRLNDGLNVGVVFYEIIHEKATYKETPVIFYTSKDNPGINGVRYISKPTDSQSIINIINELI